MLCSQGLEVHSSMQIFVSSTFSNALIKTLDLSFLLLFACFSPVNPVNLGDDHPGAGLCALKAS